MWKALITSINDRAKIEAGKLDLEAVPFDLRFILDDVLSLFSEKPSHKGVELAVFVSDNVPETVVGDPGRFLQVITNLVGNSVKFTDKGHVPVQVHLADHAQAIPGANSDATSNGGTNSAVISGIGSQCTTLSGREAADVRNSWDKFKMLIDNKEFPPSASNKVNSCDESFQIVTLIVSGKDTGIGIPLCLQESVFMPFMQANSSTFRNNGGTGIGSSISKCLVKLMDGHISFASLPQIGSTCSFAAVFKRCQKITTGDMKKSVAGNLPTAFKGLKAILVDERPIRAAITKYHLRRLGMHLRIVGNIRTAVTISVRNSTMRPGNGSQPEKILIEKGFVVI